jgi:hypothetical protein
MRFSLLSVAPMACCSNTWQCCLQHLVDTCTLATAWHLSTSTFSNVYAFYSLHVLILAQLHPIRAHMHACLHKFTNTDTPVGVPVCMRVGLSVCMCSYLRLSICLFVYLPPYMPARTCTRPLLRLCPYSCQYAIVHIHASISGYTPSRHTRPQALPVTMSLL